MESRLDKFLNLDTIVSEKRTHITMHVHWDISTYFLYLKECNKFNIQKCEISDLPSYFLLDVRTTK